MVQIPHNFHLRHMLTLHKNYLKRVKLIDSEHLIIKLE